MKAKRATTIPAICLVISAFGLGLGVYVLSRNMVTTSLAALFFLTGSLPSFIALWFSSLQGRTSSSE